MTTRAERAPAKINIGLEILGKRSDGYHEIRSVLCKISLHDTLTFESSMRGRDRVTFQGCDLAIADEHNLILRALRAARDAGAQISPQHVLVMKRIPAAAGLGGASSNAASTLKAFAPELRAAGADIAAIAGSLGSDVPFFLNRAFALVSGRGDRLAELPSPADDRWVVLVTPRLAIPNKTQAMYRSVDPAWWSDGSKVKAFAEALPGWTMPIPPNTFERALLRRYPAAERIRDEIYAAGSPPVALSGAGPTWYTLVDSESAARALAARLDDLAADINVAKLAWNEAQRHDETD